MSKPFSILHISDLHRSRHDPISNDELISALVSDRERYVHEDPSVPTPNAIVVSGDIIQGVGMGTKDFAKDIADQYDVAEEFLDELVRRFLHGDRSQLVMVPGNHDIDWNTARSALELVDETDIPSDLQSVLYTENSDFRWDWKTQNLYRISDANLYESRLKMYWQFFDKFYEGVSGIPNVATDFAAKLFSICDDRIGVVAFNSCHGNDCFAFHGMIRKEVIARSHLQLVDAGKVFDMRMAVWHHSIDGPPYRTDYMDVDIVRGMIGRGFRLGLYGHQHKSQVVPHQIWLPDQERMAVVSAGSLCAGGNELPVGAHRQYNILEIPADLQSVRVHVRQMAVSNLFSRGHLMDFGGASFAELDWELPRSPVGSAVNTNAERARAIIEEAEMASKTGSPERAVELLALLRLEPDSYERQLYLSAATDTEDWTAIVELTNPPISIEELIQRFESFIRLAEPAKAVEALDNFSQQVQLPEPVETELRHRASAQEAMQ